MPAVPMLCGVPRQDSNLPGLQTRQSTRPHPRAVTHRLGPGAPVFVCLVVRLRYQRFRLLALDQRWKGKGQLRPLAARVGIIREDTS
jgi:hypothetical protein